MPSQQQLDDWNEPESFLAARSIKRQLLEELSEPSGPTNADLADLLGRWPTEVDKDPDVAGLLFEDFRNRSLRGEPVSRAKYEQDYPEHRDSLASLFRKNDLIRSVTSISEPSVPTLALPKVGDELFGYRLRDQLGQGAFARVFLAEQSELAGRLVALKTSDLTGSEPQTLAQLQHTNIVPIYSVHEDTAAGVRAVCMPYFGGASLSQVLQKVWKKSDRPTCGAEFADAIGSLSKCESVSDGESESRKRSSHSHSQTLKPSHGHASPLERIAQLDFAQACAWIVARLAEGLQHAHDRGVLHRDIKPGNILLGGDGTPMLLDFNLAHDENQSNAQVEATLGGTVAYMAPEHLRALNIRTPELVAQVDERSDVYGLGMVLFEMITGHNPFESAASYSAMPILVEAMAAERLRSIPSLRVYRDDVAWGLESIVRKCLQPRAEERYQRAADLAEDIDRLLNNQPLRYAPELSRKEQIQKWTRRHPKLASSGLIAIAGSLLLTLGWFALTGTQARLTAAQARVRETEGAEARERLQQFERGTLKALCLANTHSEHRDHEAQGRRLCEETLRLFGVLDDPNWQDRPIWSRLTETEQLRLAEDARELLLLLASATEPSPTDSVSVVHWPSHNNSDVTLTNVTNVKGSMKTSCAEANEPLGQAQWGALALLDRAEAIRGLPPSAAVWRERATLHRLAGDADRAEECDRQAEEIPPTTARDFYLLASARLHDDAPDRLQQALADLQRAVQLDPRHYWAWMQKGLCHLELGESQLALSDFSVCVGLWPEFAWGYFNRAYTLDKLGQKSAAVTDYTAALNRDPDLTDARRNRGLAHLELGQPADALADFDQLGQHDAALDTLRGQAFELLHRPNEADVAFERALTDANLATLPAAKRHQLLCAFGFAVSSRRPRDAESAFARIPSDDPKFAEALYGRGLLASNADRAERAIELFSQALSIRPHFSEPLRFRAILQARLGRFNEAIADINTALQATPNSGPTFYAAACVTALASAQAPNKTAARQAADESIRFLRQAQTLGYGHNAKADDDLKAIKEHPEFP